MPREIAVAQERRNPARHGRLIDRPRFRRRPGAWQLLREPEHSNEIRRRRPHADRLRRDALRVFSQLRQVVALPEELQRYVADRAAGCEEGPRRGPVARRPSADRARELERCSEHGSLLRTAARFTGSVRRRRGVVHNVEPAAGCSLGLAGEGIDRQQRAFTPQVSRAGRLGPFGVVAFRFTAASTTTTTTKSRTPNRSS